MLLRNGLLPAVLLSVSIATGAVSAQVTTVSIVEKAGITTANYPVTLSMVFRQGDVADHVYASVNSVSVNTQTDVKVRWPDGSVKHALVSLLIPTLSAGSTASVALYSGGTNYNTDWVTRPELEATAFGAAMTVTVAGTPTTINARDLLASQGTEEHWIKGNVCSEFIIRHWPTNIQIAGVGQISVQYHVRTYPGYNGGNNFRIDAIVENCWVHARGNLTYDFDLKVGYPLATVLAKTGLTHIYNSRWHKVAWQGATPPAVEIRYDTAYMVSTGLIFPLDTSLTMSESTMASKYAVWQASSHDIMQTGILNTYFPATGDVEQIGPYPAWTCRYLVSMDNRMKEIMLNCADLSAGIQVHIRESDLTKPSYGHSLSFLDRPTADAGLATKGTLWDQVGPMIGSSTSPWGPDTAHQPSFSYIPYLVTGDLFYLEENYFWASHNVMDPCSGDDTGMRQGGMGILYGDGQARAKAWTLRTAALTAAIAPDADVVEKEACTACVTNTLAQWQTEFVNNTSQYPLIHTLDFVMGGGEEFDDDVSAVISPWMVDFGIFTLRHMLDLGLNPAGHTLSTLNWLADMRINMFCAPGYNWNRGAAYRLAFMSRDAQGVDHPVTSWAEANNLFLDDVGPLDLPNPDDPFSYRYIARSSLAGLLHVTGGQAAWDWLDTHIHNKESLASNPKYSLVPTPMGDVTPPAAVADLAAGTPTSSSLVVSWTAPGDDSSTGTATRYDLRYSTQPITTLTWPQAAQMADEPLPAAAETAQNKTVAGLAYDTTYYFAIKTIDEKGNTSALSNVPSGATSQLPGTQTITFQNGVLPTTGYAGCDDTRIASAYPAYNYGTQTTTTVGDYGGKHRVLMRFDITAIPAGQTIVSAKLRLWHMTGATCPVRIEAYELLRPWTETGGTWSNYAASLLWTTAGCDGVGTDRGNVVLGSTTIPSNTSSQWVEITLPNALVQGWHNNSVSNQGVMLRGYHEVYPGGRAEFAADSHATAAKRPQLIVKYLINTPPAVDVGADQTIVEGQAVELHAAASDADNDPLGYAWIQLAGLSVDLARSTAANASFTAPAVETIEQATMVFRVTVTDGRGGQAADSLTVRVRMLGDINQDDSIDVVDLLTFVDAFGSVNGEPDYDPTCDFNSDGGIDVVDLLELVANFGRSLG